MIEVTKDILKDIYKGRPKNSKKYDFGNLLVIGGSDFYSGSPALSSLAAFKSGVDMVKIIAPRRAADIIASFSPILAAYPLEGTHLNGKHLSILLSLTEAAKEVSRGKTAVVIGGGIGRSDETQEAILKYLSEISVPAVIDADAFYALGEKPELALKILKAGKNFLLTPHIYEFFILTKREISKLSEEEKIKAVQEEAEHFKATILLKGPTDIISNGEETALNRTGTPYMSKGGTGDTLAGICGALLSRGISPFKAAQAAAYINGIAGELAGKKLQESLTAIDVIDEIPNVLPKVNSSN